MSQQDGFIKCARFALCAMGVQTCSGRTGSALAGLKRSTGSTWIVSGVRLTVPYIDTKAATLYCSNSFKHVERSWLRSVEFEDDVIQVEDDRALADPPKTSGNTAQIASLGQGDRELGPSG